MPKRIIYPPKDGVIVSSGEVFTAESLCGRLGISQQALRGEIRRGHMRFSKRLNRHWFLGEWILDWLRGGERKKVKREDRP